MKKEDVERMLDIMDIVFNDINSGNKKKGTGLQFSYDFKVTPPNEKLKVPTAYIFAVKIREAGHGEKVLQEFTYHKPESYDLHTMKHQVILSVITVMFESTMLQWNELGKILNKDKTLQKAAIIL